jgi:hypothetical protein
MRGITDHVTYIPFRVKYYSLVRDESFKEIRYIEEIEDGDREEHERQLPSSILLHFQ